MRNSESRPGGRAPRPYSDNLLRWIGQLVLYVFFRRIEVLGLERFPGSGPVVVVANHQNSLVDSMLLIARLPRFPRFLGASIVWRYKLLVPILQAAGVIPVYRRQDVGAQAGRHDTTFSACWDLLRADGVLALFPEGVSHNAPEVLPTKSGAARIALEAESQFGPLGVQVVPVGLVFEAKSKFRSRALLQIGEPMDVATYAATYEAADRSGRARVVRDLSREVHNRLTALLPGFESLEGARLIGRAAEIWAQPVQTVPRKAELSRAFARSAAFLTGFRSLRERHPDRMARIRERVATYDQALTASGLRDEHVAAEYPLGAVLVFLLQSLISLLLRLPVAAIGTVLSFIPYRISIHVGRPNDLDKRATFSLFSSVLLFPVFWLAQGWAIGAATARWVDPSWAWPLAIAAVVLAPLCGVSTLVFYDNVWRLLFMLKGWFRMRRGGKVSASLIAQRRDIRDELVELVALYQAETGEPGETR